LFAQKGLFRAPWFFIAAKLQKRCFLVVFFLKNSFSMNNFFFFLCLQFAEKPFYQT